ncbi:hypothetical protein ACFQXA_02200 [Nocardiopsis composta]
MPPLRPHGRLLRDSAALTGVTATPDRFTAAVDTIGIAALASFLRHLPRSATRT